MVSYNEKASTKGSAQGLARQRRTKAKLDNSQDTGDTRDASCSLGGCGAAVSQADIASRSIKNECGRIRRGGRSKGIRVVGDLDIDVAIRQLRRVEMRHCVDTAVGAYRVVKY